MGKWLKKKRMVVIIPTLIFSAAGFLLGYYVGRTNHAEWTRWAYTVAVQAQPTTGSNNNNTNPKTTRLTRLAKPPAYETIFEEQQIAGPTEATDAIITQPLSAPVRP
jgi:hypothetical protein